jgi:hypothetical protein
MAAIFEEIKGAHGRSWECKHCHLVVGESETIAYHLIDGILYGWCESCFSKRGVAGITE